MTGLRIPGPGRDESSLELTAVCSWVAAELGRFVMEALAEYRGRAAVGWLRCSKVCMVGTDGAEFVRYDPNCSHGAPWLRLGVDVNA